MSRPREIADLIARLLDVFVSAPTDNCRPLFLLADDLCELVMKSYMKDQHKTYPSGNPNFIDVQRYFASNLLAVIALQGISPARPAAATHSAWVSLVPKDDKGKEPHIVALKADPTYVVIYPTCQPLVDVLLKVFDRHIRRNQIHHDPEFMRATMDETQACEALADAVKLAVILYPEVQNELVSNYLSHALWLWFRLHAKYMQTKDYKIEKEINRIFAEKVSAGGGKRVRNRGCHLLEDRDFGFKWLNLRHESADLVPLLNAAATKFGV